MRLLLAAREHHEGLLREFRLLSLEGTGRRHDFPARLVTLTRMEGARLGAARQRQDHTVEEAGAQGHDTVDVTYTVLPSTAEMIVVMDDLRPTRSAHRSR